MINDMNFSLLPFLDKMPAQVNLYKEVNAFSQQASVMYYLY